MVYYRVVQQVALNNGSNTLKWQHYNTLRDAYVNCIPEDETETCRRLLNGVQDEIAKGDTFIRVTCDRGNIWWIQLVEDQNEQLGPVAEVASKIDCCHAHI
jgi:hypothetical protein